MAEYLVLAENISFKNNKLTCINIYDRLSTIAMPSEFRFDLAIMCGPNWAVGEHKLTVKAVGSNGKEVYIGELAVKIPNEDFVYNAFANDIKLIMDYSVESLTFVVYDNGKEIIAKKYPVISMLVPQNPDAEKKNLNNEDEVNLDAELDAELEAELKSESETKSDIESSPQTKVVSRFGTPKRPKYGEFLNLKTEQALKDALEFISKLSDDNKMKDKLKANIEQQLKALKNKKKG